MMNRSAILHVPMSNYCHGIDQEHILFRLRCGRNDLDECNLWYGDTACRTTPVVFTKCAMHVTSFDELFDYFEIVLQSPFNRVCYYFELVKGDERTYYYGDLFYDKIVNERAEYYKLPYNRKEDIVDVPKWLKDAVVYNIFPDSFATGRRYISKEGTTIEQNGLTLHGKLGGTIQGIIDNLDYISEMGFNCVYLNPIFTASEYHKYDLIDYYSIDPCFGSNEDFKNLVEDCHKRNMKVIIDGVFNHCGWNFFAFDDVVRNGENSRYKEWFYKLKFPVIRPQNGDIYPNYECFGYERLMPKMNTSNAQVKEYFLDVAKFWIEKYDIDGWRLDVADEVNSDFWREFRKTVKTTKKDVAIIGEVWQTASFWLDGSMFDSTMNYDLLKHCKCFMAENSITGEEFNGRVTHMRNRYKKQFISAQLNLLDSHDVPRFLSICKGNEDKYKIALVFQMTFIGAPSVFYGDEQGLDGLHEEEYRQPMRFENTPLKQFVTKLISLRNECPQLKGDAFETEIASADGGLFSYVRGESNERIRVILNASEKSEKIEKSLLDSEILMQNNLSNGVMLPNSFVIIKI